MARHTFVTRGSAASGLKIEFQPLPASEQHPSGHAWGELSLWIGETLVWSLKDGDDDKPVTWSWVEFLEGIGRIWPWLTLEESYPISILPEHPGKIDLELIKRWDEMDQAQRDNEEDLMFDFKHRHNLALLLRGVYLPPVIAIREGGEMVIWSSACELPIRIRLIDFVSLLSEFGDYLSGLLESSEDLLAKLARLRWQERVQKTIAMKNSDTFGIEDPTVIGLLQRSNEAVESSAANDDLYFDNETRAAARMTARKITAREGLK